jgi:hypothetical protein
MATRTSRIDASAGTPYGHVPGHTYSDCDISAHRAHRGCIATLTLSWGSAQGHDEEHGRTEYARTATTLKDAIERVRDGALSSEDDECIRSYIETAAAKALEQLYPRRPVA